jgi:hypothetical protein
MSTWTIGLEIELACPVGSTRSDVAATLAVGRGTVRRDWHFDTEPSLVPNRPVFHNLTPAFEVVDPEGRRLVRVADDLTLQADFDKQAAPKAGWYRVLSDDARLLRVVRRHLNPDAPLTTALDAAAPLFRGVVEVSQGTYRLADETGAPIAMAAPLPGERERPCELITAPLGADWREQLTDLLRRARDLRLFIPAEGATHIHVDGAPFQDAGTLHRLARLIDGHEAALRAWVGTNPRCRRLGPWSDRTRATLLDPTFASLPWSAARDRLKAAELTKF